MKNVRQEHPYGCAVAAIATIAGLSYRCTLNRLGMDVRRLVEQGGMWHDLVFVALQRLGFATAIEFRAQWGKPRERWRPVPICDVNIAQVAHPLGAHAVVVLRDGTVMDPSYDDERRIEDYDFHWIAGVIPIRDRGAEA